MTFRRIATTSTTLAALSAIAAAPFAAAAPAPKPVDPNLTRSVPGTSCTVGQLRASINRVSPAVLARLDQAAGGPKQFADIATSDPTTRQFRLAALAFTTSGDGFAIFQEQGKLQDVLADAYRTCSAPVKK